VKRPRVFDGPSSGTNRGRSIGDITNVQVIAAGRGIRRLKTLRKRHGGRRWRKLKVMLPFDWRMDRCAGPRFTGTRLTASARGDWRSSASSI